MSSRIFDRPGRAPAVLAFGAIVLALAVPLTFAAPAARWLQWGGPTQDFLAPSEGLADRWPETGPKELWSRELGDGYSAILVDDGRVYTMYRAGDQEAVIALDAATGKTVWEHRYDAAPAEGHIHDFGDGPRATPLIAGDRLYGIGVSGVMHALKKSDGSVLWTQDLWKDFGGTFLAHGYSSSPVVYGDQVIALVGGEGHALVAFDKDDGKVAWKGLDFANSYSAPQILSVDGEDQIVTLMAEELIGVDPKSGELEWRYEFGNQFQQNMNVPVLTEGRNLFLSSIQSGSRGLELRQVDGKTEVKEVWSTRKIQFYHVSTVRQGEWVYGTTGGTAPHFMSAINVKTGEIAWRKRGFGKSNCVGADGKLLILEEDGRLTLATASPEDLVVKSQATVLERVAWTTPTVVGKTMYVRDKKTIKALDLS
jgi:outer membrane protein assembly factor BamB